MRAAVHPAAVVGLEWLGATELLSDDPTRQGRRRTGRGADRAQPRGPLGGEVRPHDGAVGVAGNTTRRGGAALVQHDGSNRPQYYQTIQFADVTGQGQEYLLARSAAGLQTWRWDASTDTFEAAGPTLTTLSDSADWSGPQYYSTIQTADIAGTGQRFLLARGTAGLFTFQWGANGWTQAGPVLAALSNSSCGRPACTRRSRPAT